MCTMHFDMVLWCLVVQLKFTVSRKRRYFEFPCTFSDHNASSHSDCCVEIASQEDSASTLHMMEMDIAVQVG